MKYIQFKRIFNLGFPMLILFFLYSCNVFSAVGIENHGLPIKEVDVDLLSSTKNLTVKIDHSQWDSLLKKYVDNEGFVDYKGFKKEVTLLDKYLTMLSQNDPKENWSVQELLAYYINLYNAATVKLIVENYPVKSIRDIDRSWTKNIISIGNKMISLDDVEHNILRKMNEPRIHFALNCASISCPKLSNEAYTASKINEQLERATKDFINSDNNNIGASNSKISPLFKWYIKDFKVNTTTDLITFINQYSNVKMNPESKVMFQKYDWNLNERK